MARLPFSSLEPLEARIAPAALSVLNPFSDIIAGVGKTGATVDLGHMFEELGSQRTLVEFITNFDTDPGTPGLQAGKIVIELFDDKAPLTVQNFLGYVNNKNARGDYDGTFFHRAAFIGDTPFVLQGGGFEVTDLTKHIPTAPPVHNEYNEYGITPESNVRGTIALAKTAVGPNTGTSEFFFNLSDNSANLDQQNGGFAVFGRVTEGMDVVDAIAALQKWNFGSLNGNGALSDVPAQGYNPTPNSSGVSPLPTANQLIQITDARVLPAQDAHHAGVVYSVSITDESGNPSKLVTGKLTGDTLNLAYKPGASGVAKVTVTAQKDGDIVLDEFDVVVKPNLIASSAGDTLPEIVIPGNKGVAKVNVTNNGAGMMKGKVDVKFYLSEINAQDPGGNILDSGDVEIGSLSGKALKLASGKSATLSGKVTVPQTLALENGQQYRVLAQVITPDGSSVTELFTDDNVALDGRVHAFVNQQGTNLVAYAADSTISGVAIPGDTGTGKVWLYNNTGQTAKGTVDVGFFLSRIDGTSAQTADSDSYGTIWGEDDVLIGSVLGKNVTVPAGKSVVLKSSIQLPTELVQVQGELFRVIAVVMPSANSTIGEFTTNDNLAYDVSAHRMFNAFGSFGAQDPSTGQQIVRKNVTLTYTDTNDQLVKVSLKKGGYGELNLDANGDIHFLSTFHTTAKSTLSVNTSGAQHTSLRNVTSDNNPLGTVAMAGVDITGDIHFVGGVKNLSLGNLAASEGASGRIEIGQLAGDPKAKTNIRLGSVTDYNLFSNMLVTSLTVATWENQNDTEEIIAAPALSKFVSQQNLEASLTVVNQAKVQSFTVGGTLSGVDVAFFGDVGSIKLGAMQDSAIFVGFGPGNQIRDNAVLGSFTIRDAAGTPDLMANSRVFVTHSIGKVNIQSVAPDSGSSTDPFGITTHAIKSYNRGTAHLKNLIGPVTTPPDSAGNYLLRLV